MLSRNNQFRLNSLRVLVAYNHPLDIADSLFKGVSPPLLAMVVCVVLM